MGHIPLKYFASLLLIVFACFTPSFATKNISGDIHPGVYIVISSGDIAFRSGQVAFYKELTIPPNTLSEVLIDFNGAHNTTDQIAFGIIQAHSCYYNITLGYNRTIERRYHETGTNLGLIVRNESNPTRVYIHNNIYQERVQISIAFIPYNRSDPIPGGCSMEQPMQEVPSLVLSVNPDMTSVDTPLAATPDGSCSSAPKLGYTGFHRFLDKFDFSCSSYFANLRAMMTAEQIRNNGKLGYAHPTTANRRTYVTVPGTGVVFASLVTDHQYGSLAAYVPVYSVACSPIFWESNCNVFSSPLFHVLSLWLIGVGIIRAYLGSFLFCIGAAIDGFVLGAFLTYYAQCNWWSEYVLTVDEEISLLCVSGGLVAAVMFAFWFLCPFGEMITQIPTNIIVGYILTAFTTSVITDADWRHAGYWYEMLFLLITAIMFVILPPCWNPSGLLLSVAWGSFAIMQTVFYFRGSHSAYWVMNSFNFLRNKEFR